jgi:hypothetical protein
MGVQYCTLKTDLEVIASQIEKVCMARDKTLERYLAAIRRMQNHFKGFTIEHIKRTKNTEVDKLTKAVAKSGKYHTRRRLASTNHGIPSPVLRA